MESQYLALFCLSIRLSLDVTREKVGTMDKIKDGLKHEMDEFGAATGLQGWQVMALVVILVILVIGLCGWCVFRFFRKKRKAKKGEETRGYKINMSVMMRLLWLGMIR